jgi:hypothetical protein
MNTVSGLATRNAGSSPSMSPSSRSEVDDDDDEHELDDDPTQPPKTRRRTDAAGRSASERLPLDAATQRKRREGSHGAHGSVRRPAPLDADSDASLAIAMRRSARCFMDHAQRMGRTAQYWMLKHKSREDALSWGTRATIGPMGYAGYSRLVRIFKDFRQALTAMGGSWELYQTEAASKFINVNIKRILGQDVDSCLEHVMRQYGWTDIQSHVFVQAYRGAGKSALSAAIVSALLVNIPHFTMTMYGGPKDKAVDLFETFSAYLDELLARRPDTAAKFRINKTGRRIRIQAGPTDVRWVEVQFSRGNVRSCGCFVLCRFVCFGVLGAFSSGRRQQQATPGPPPAPAPATTTLPRPASGSDDRSTTGAPRGAPPCGRGAFVRVVRFDSHPPSSDGRDRIDSVGRG